VKNEKFIQSRFEKTIWLPLRKKVIIKRKTGVGALWHFHRRAENRVSMPFENSYYLT